jgi:hypothetical protein
MMIRANRFNIFLLVLLVLGLACGCKTEERKRKKVLATFRLHADMRKDGKGESQTAAINRDQPVKITVEKVPFVTEQYLQEVGIVEGPGGWMISVQLDREGMMLLEQATAIHGRRVAVFSQWDPEDSEKLNEGRWLAAPRIQNHVTDGRLVFTPDATREEAERIVLGLNNVIARIHRGETIKW